MKPHDPNPPRMPRLPPPLTISLLYLIFGTLWIFFSDRIAAVIATSEQQLQSLSNIKGWFFIAITALLLYALLLKDARNRKVGNQALSESESRFKELFKHTTTDMAIYQPVEDNSDFVFVDINPTGLQEGQISKKEVIGRKVTDVFPGVEKSGLLDVFRRVAKTGKPEHYPLVKYQDDRIGLWVENDVFKLPSGLIVALYNDTSEKQKTEEKIRLQASVLDQIQDFVTVTDLEENITYINQAAEKHFGIPASELIGKSVDAFGEDQEQGAIQQEIMNQTLHNGHWHGEVNNRLPNGKNVLLDCRSLVVRNSGGRPIGICSVSTDITTRKEIEKKLKATNAELAQFNKMAIGRELRMIELKEEINTLCREQGRAEPYR